MIVRFGAMDLMALSGFAFVASITPGPNNVMLWASGLNHGMRRTVPHLVGINLGFMSLLALVSLGLGAFVVSVPALSLAIKATGSAYLLYLAHRVATADVVAPAVGDPVAEEASSSDREGTSPGGVGRRGADTRVGEGGRPLTVWQAAAFQYVNPKAWLIGVTGAGLALPADVPLRVSAPLFVATFGAVNLPCIAVWAGAGNVVGKLVEGRWRRTVNRILGLSLAASVVLLVI